MKKTKNSLEEACTSGVNPEVQAFFVMGHYSSSLLSKPSTLIR